MYVRMADAAYAANIPGGFEIAAGYYGGPNAYHVWTPQDWARFPGFRLPIWVAARAGITGSPDGTTQGRAAVEALRDLGVPAGSITVLDLELATRAVAFVDDFGSELSAAGYRVWPYGSASAIFTNPPLNGYWVADYTSDMGAIDALLQSAHVRAVQFQADVWPGYDVSLVKQWTEGEMWRGSGE